jgi:hypothetical protein
VGARRKGNRRLRHRCAGLRELARENGWTRYGSTTAPGVIDIRETPHERRGSWGVGAVHHLAWRVADLDEELRVRQQVEDAGGRATDIIDRFWFKSVYFKEPGGRAVRDRHRRTGVRGGRGSGASGRVAGAAAVVRARRARKSNACCRR